MPTGLPAGTGSLIWVGETCVMLVSRPLIMAQSTLPRFVPETVTTAPTGAAVGEKLAKMLEMGQSRPWPDALEALTGERKMDATAILEYFAPLKQWLDEQNKGRTLGY